MILWIRQNRDQILHWTMSFVGGFIGAYAVLLFAGNFASAETGNLVRLAIDFSNWDWPQVILRLLAVFFFSFGIFLSYILTNYTKIWMQRFILWVDAVCVAMTALLPDLGDPLINLYPIFFCAAMQWGTYSGARGYNSASIFATNNIKQTVLGFTQYVATKDHVFQEKGIFYLMTIVSFTLGAFVAAISAAAFGLWSAFVVWIPLLIARIWLLLGPIETISGTPEESREEAIEIIEEATILEEEQ